ncbi:MAG: hypothetical protein EXR69_12610 [Myxococcales bacterium]|nr:hypothetical protein [Myxococcales bacterium]
MPATPRIVKKYGNRRLYDTVESKYINLAELAALIKAGDHVLVEDATTKADLTRELYFQVLFEHEGAMDFLPLGMLRRIIRATGEDPAQKLLRQQLGQAFHLLSDQLDRMEAWTAPAAGWATPPRAAAPASAAPAAPSAPLEPSAPPDEPAPPRDAPPRDDLTALRARLAALEEKLGR